MFVPRGQTFLTHRRGGTNIFTLRGGTKNFTQGGGQTFYVVGGGGHDDVDVDEEIYVSEVNFLVSEASKLSAGARIFRGP